MEMEDDQSASTASTAADYPATASDTATGLGPEHQAWGLAEDEDEERQRPWMRAICILGISLAAAGAIVALGYTQHIVRPQTPTPPHRSVAAPSKPVPPAPPVSGPQLASALATMPDAVLMQTPAPAAAVPAPAPSGGEGSGGSGGMSADAQYLRLLRQEGMTVYNPGDAVHNAHLICSTQGKPPFPDGYQTAVALTKVFPGTLDLDGAETMVAAAETIYCPQYH